jgi:hypothetical protein
VMIENEEKQLNHQGMDPLMMMMMMTTSQLMKTFSRERRKRK